MIKLEIDNILANYFAIHSADKVTFPALKKIKKFLEQEVEYNINIDLTRKSILNSWRRSPRLFEYHEDCADYPYFERGSETRDLEKINLKYNWNIPKEIREIYQGIILQFA